MNVNKTKCIEKKPTKKVNKTYTAKNITIDKDDYICEINLIALSNKNKPPTKLK